jgi:hypothetical protein
MRILAPDLVVMVLLAVESNLLINLIPAINFRHRHQHIVSGKPDQVLDQPLLMKSFSLKV